VADADQCAEQIEWLQIAANIAALNRAQFDALLGPTGALLIGDSETISEKILYVKRRSRRPFSNHVPNGCLGSTSREDVKVDHR
jgi:hypothetical protein